MIQQQQTPQPPGLSAESDYHSIFNGGGEMGALMRSYNWEAHPLGKPDGWPQSLKANIRLILNSAFPMFIWWSEDFYMFHNDAYLPALGNKHPQALGASARDMWSEIWADVGVIGEDILRSGKQFYAENLPLFLHRKGFLEETFWSFSYSPAFDDENRVAGLFCACYEVSSTLLAQRRLKTLKDISEAMFLVETQEQACQAACDKLKQDQHDIPFSLIYLLNQVTNSAHLCGVSGALPLHAAPEIISLAEHDSFWPLGEVLSSKEMQQVNLNGMEFTSPVSGKMSTFVSTAVVIPIFNPGQKETLGFFIAGVSPLLEYNADYQNFMELLVGHIGTSVTRVQGLEEIERQKVYLNEVFEQAPVGITILNGPSHEIVLANEGICKLWGRTKEDVLGKPILEALPEVADQGIKQLLDDVLHTGVPYINNELPLMLERNGKLEVDYFSFVYQPKRNSHGVITGVIAVAISINEQVENRLAIEAINRELLAANADLDNFVYSASHDLKAPITNIEGLVDALMENLPAETLASNTVQHLVAHIKNSIDRFKKAVTDLTQVAKIQREAEEDVLHIDLKEVVENIKLDFETMIAVSNATIETDFDENSIVRFSAKNIRSVLYNLLSNALKYRSPDRQPHIRIKTENTPEYFILTVSDNGLGVEESKKNKIFTMFKRLHDHVEGTGVGMYIVKRIVENAGGKIEVESELGKGTTFKVYLLH